jgi:hypothetical protein
MMNGTCELKELNELSGALTPDAYLGDHCNTINILFESNTEINQVFKMLSSIAPSTATQNVKKNDPKVRSYSNDCKTPDETDSDLEIDWAPATPARASTQADTNMGSLNIDAKENQGTQSSVIQYDKIAGSH